MKSTMSIVLNPFEGVHWLVAELATDYDPHTRAEHTDILRTDGAFMSEEAVAELILYRHDVGKVYNDVRALAQVFQPHEVDVLRQHLAMTDIVDYLDHLTMYASYEDVRATIAMNKPTVDFTFIDLGSGRAVDIETVATLTEQKSPAVRDVNNQSRLAYVANALVPRQAERNE